MNIKTGILAAAAALTLTVPAAAFAQPSYGHDYGRYDTWRRDRDDSRRGEREREHRRDEWRRQQWEREHAYRYDYGNPYYR
jgi:hypothetical protein